MRLLLDTHTLIWWFIDDPRLGRRAEAALSDAGNSLHVSAVSAYEITLKHRYGKLPEVAPLVDRFEDWLAAEEMAVLPVGSREARAAAAFDHPHKDPFDRMLIAQALLNDLTLVSNERRFDDFGVSRLW